MESGRERRGGGARGRVFSSIPLPAAAAGVSLASVVGVDGRERPQEGRVRVLSGQNHLAQTVHHALEGIRLGRGEGRPLLVELCLSLKCVSVCVCVCFPSAASEAREG